MIKYQNKVLMSFSVVENADSRLKKYFYVFFLNLSING